ncbi:MAG: RNA-binding transcriptional accessory protein, partial [Hyphomicrobiales bacterium]|nr:RNA-binding transcriptional accessory protein [Hyphomicrobiales bacterium]
KIVAACGRDVRSLMGDSGALKALDPNLFIDERFGLPTVRDIIAELEKPGRDPRPEFKTATFADGIDSIKDLKPGMMLEGTVTNVAAFGAFVDIGVHQDGLVHLSQLADRFVKDAHEVVKAGDVVRVRVVDVDIKRNRIGLTMRKQDDGGASRAEPRVSKPASPAPAAKPAAPKNSGRKEPPPSQGAFGAALSEALKRK